ncbi:MAG: phosphotransferase [Gemmatimonadota bacterium]|nr:phosphotransferase [Gemmatimonadota bacterium]
MDLSDPIADVKGITQAELTDRLVRNSFIRSGWVISVEKGDSFETSAAKWDRLTVAFSDDYDGDVSNALVLKVFRKGWFGGGVLEWEFYNELAPKTPGTHVCPVYDGGIDHTNKICHLIMADLSGTHTEPPMNAKDRPHEQVVAELLKYHVRWWNDPRLETRTFYVRHGGPLRMAQAIAKEDIYVNCRAFEPALRDFSKDAGDELLPSWIETTERVIAKYPEVFHARVSGGQNITLLHGDAHVWNLFYPKNAATDRLILFDWETYKRGIGAYDLAYMLVHGTSGRRQIESGLMNQYYQGLIAGGISSYSHDEFIRDFRLSIISCVFCPLIWKRVISMKFAMEAYEDWGCEELLK